mmetsp:Transcript_20470/g.33210  ORF Transcript_20470/g.33210 Transcript_20470/m.33210 type:complete len:99 (+) Transcript_20470:128-424(+)
MYDMRREICRFLKPKKSQLSPLQEADFKNFECPSIPLTNSSFPPTSLYDTTVGTENSRNASATDITPIAELLRPENGAVSGDRPHCALMLIFPKTVEN